MKVTSVQDARWLDAEKSRFICAITFEELGEERLPFTFDPFDRQKHSIWLGEEWLPANLDAVAPYEPPSQEELTAEQAALTRSKRDQLLQKSDIVVLPDRWAVMSTEQQQAWSNYCQSLRDITEQVGFPWEVTWPEKP